MAIILRKQLFEWQEIDELGEKIFLRLVDETKTLLPDFKTGFRT